LFLFRLRSDLQTANEMNVIGIGCHRQLFLDLTFASVGQCKYVLDKAQIGADEWMGKRADLDEEHKTPDAREQLKKGFKDWISSDLFMEQRSKADPIPKSTKTIIVSEP
jgi:hypothetical protein